MYSDVLIDDKQIYLAKNYPFSNPPSLDEEVVCIHCNRTFKVGNYKVYQDDAGEEYICCAYTPDCDGTVIEWINIG